MLSVCLYCKRKRWMKPWRWSKTTITCTGHQTVQSWFSKKCQFLKCSFFQALASSLSEDNHAERRAVAVENEGGEAAPLSCTCFCSFYRPRAPDCSVVRRSTSTLSSIQLACHVVRSSPCASSRLATNAPQSCKSPLLSAV